MAHEYVITITTDGDVFHVSLDGESLSTHPMIEGAKFAAVQVAREIRPEIKRLEFREAGEDELGLAFQITRSSVRPLWGDE